jgi:hypothetical protein
MVRFRIRKEGHQSASTNMKCVRLCQGVYGIHKYKTRQDKRQDKRHDKDNTWQGKRQKQTNKKKGKTRINSQRHDMIRQTDDNGYKRR